GVRSGAAYARSALCLGRIARAGVTAESPTVVVPGRTRAAFEKRTALDVRPVYFELRAEPLARRVLRRLGVLDETRGPAGRLEILDGGEPRLAEALALWLPWGRLPAAQMSAILDRLPRLRWVYSQATGTDHLDLELFRRRGLVLSN